MPSNIVSSNTVSSNVISSDIISTNVPISSNTSIDEFVWYVNLANKYQVPKWQQYKPNESKIIEEAYLEKRIGVNVLTYYICFDKFLQ